MKDLIQTVLITDTSYHMLLNAIWEFSSSIAVCHRIQAKQHFILPEIHSKHYLLLSEIWIQHNTQFYWWIQFKHYFVLSYQPLFHVRSQLVEILVIARFYIVVWMCDAAIVFLMIFRKSSENKWGFSFFGK